MSQNTKEKTIWGIHAGKTGDAATLFLKHSCVALGWDQMGDLSQLAPNRKAFKAALAKTYPKKKPGAIPNNAGQLFRFLHEMKKGDLVVFPNKTTRKLHIGKITGDYEYAPKLAQGYPNIRKVEWLMDLDRKNFSQGALYEIGSAMSLFQVKNHADEFRAALDGKAIAPIVSEDETVSAVAENIEENTRDFVLKSLSRELKGLPLEDFIRHLLECMGYQARLTKKNEPSVDVIAHKDQLGIEPPIIKVQVKSGDGTASDKDVSALYGKLSAGEYGLFITLGSFSSHAHSFEQGKGNLRLIDGEELVDLIFQNYERFDARYKGLLPLRSVYVPEPIDDTED
ncbi:MAG: restriction endonuclease [Verrucomicrobiales bacterium]|nr:restriction endonuclease [Verrucomicrobiota bacterium JB025]